MPCTAFFNVNTDLKEGDDIADLVISIKKEQYQASTEALLNKLKRKIKNLGLLIKKLILMVSSPLIIINFWC